MKTETKWTPRPWRVQVGRYLPMVHSPDGIVGHLSGDRAEFEANAHLVAAAPDLYEALSHLLRLNRTQSVGDEDYDAALESAEEVLTKARGEAGAI